MARRSNKQAQYKKQYSELLRNAKMIYQDLQLGLKLGEDTPSIERILKEAGTRSGLQKPTKKSIKALKKLQSESGVLRQAYWSMPKGEAREKAKELFDKAYEEEQHYKKLKRENNKINRTIDKLEKDLEDEELNFTPEQKKRIKERITELKETQREMIKADTYRFLLEVRKQVERVIEPYIHQRYLTVFEMKIVNPGVEIISFLNSALSTAPVNLLEQYEDNARDVIAEYGTIEAEDLYNDGYKILDDLRIVKVYENMIPKQNDITNEAPRIEQQAAPEQDQKTKGYLYQEDIYAEDFDPDHPIDI